jgi:hypothetical protein
MSREENIEQLIYDVLSVDQKNAGYTAAGFAISYALLQVAAAVNRLADSAEEKTRG